MYLIRVLYQWCCTLCLSTFKLYFFCRFDGKSSSYFWAQQWLFVLWSFFLRLKPKLVGNGSLFEDNWTDEWILKHQQWRFVCSGDGSISSEEVQHGNFEIFLHSTLPFRSYFFFALMKPPHGATCAPIPLAGFQGSRRVMPKILRLSARFTEWAHFLVWKGLRELLNRRHQKIGCSLMIVFPPAHTSKIKTETASCYWALQSISAQYCPVASSKTRAKWNTAWPYQRPNLLQARESKKIMLLLPVEQRWAGENSKEAIASLQCEGLCELQERADQGMGEPEGGLEGGMTEREREEWGGIGWRETGELTCWRRGQSTPLCPLQTHLSSPYWSKREIFVFITAGWLQGLQGQPTCLFWVWRLCSHLQHKVKSVIYDGCCDIASSK